MLLLINAKVWDLEHGYYGTRKTNTFFGAVSTLKNDRFTKTGSGQTQVQNQGRNAFCAGTDPHLMAISVRTTPRLFAPFYTKKHDQLAKKNIEKLQKRDACVSRRPRGSGVGRTHFTLRCWTLTRIVSGQTRHFLHHLYIKTIILPRQARDKQ